MPPAAVLVVELMTGTCWEHYLNVPVWELKKIKSTYTHDGVEMCKLEMLQFWLDTIMTASCNFLSFFLLE